MFKKIVFQTSRQGMEYQRQDMQLPFPRWKQGVGPYCFFIQQDCRSFPRDTNNKKVAKNQVC